MQLQQQQQQNPLQMAPMNVMPILPPHGFSASPGTAGGYGPLAAPAAATSTAVGPGGLEPVPTPGPPFNIFYAGSSWVLQDIAGYSVPLPPLEPNSNGFWSLTADNSGVTQHPTMPTLDCHHLLYGCQSDVAEDAGNSSTASFRCWSEQQHTSVILLV